MRDWLRFAYPQPVTALAVSALALCAYAWTWRAWLPTAERVGDNLFIVVFLTAAIILAGLYPIHIRRGTKVYMTSVPLYLAAVLLPPPYSAAAAALGVLAMSLLARARTGNLLSDMATATARWTLIVLAGSWVAHFATTDEFARVLLLFSSAGVMLVGDIVTSTFEIAPMSGESLWRVMVINAREASVMEAVQYLLAVLGVLAALQQLWALALLVLPTITVYVAFKQLKELQDDTSNLLEGLADAVDLRDPCTGGHSRRVAGLCRALLKELPLLGPEADLIVMAARVHDIGKIGMPDSILYNEHALTKEQWTIMQTHPARGAELLMRYANFARGVSLVRHHHERWDGTGYPSGLKGEAIPLGARVIAVADAFDAMTMERAYRRSISAAQAAQVLIAGRGQQWDGVIVDALLRSIANQLTATRRNDSTSVTLSPDLLQVLT